MKIVDIVRGVNRLLAGELLSPNELLPHLDSVIDDINRDLNTTFPAFSEQALTAAEYTAFPDIYIRRVVLPGAAHYFYMMDEEGAAGSPEYRNKYELEKFYMLRDYHSQVPTQYRRPVTDDDVYAPRDSCGNVITSDIDMSVFQL
jgi:hypothetical protein